MAKKYLTGNSSILKTLRSDESDAQDDLGSGHPLAGRDRAAEAQAQGEAISGLARSGAMAASHTEASESSTHAGANSAPTGTSTLSASNLMDFSTLATATVLSSVVTDTRVNKVYQHWADGDAARGSSAEWNNNILSDAKSDYFEGEVVPHVFVYKASNNAPLVSGQSYSFNVAYNYYEHNTNAGGFVYMTSPNTDRQPVPLDGLTATPDTGGFTNGGGMQGNFNTVNADVTAVSGVTYTGTTSLTAHVTVTFTYTGPTTKSGGAEIQYGLLIAKPGDVPDQGHGETNGASLWTGGSLQTTVDIGGSGSTSIQLSPSAIHEGEISGLKFNDVNGDGLREANGADNIGGTADDEVGMGGWTIFIDSNNNGQLDAGERSTVTDHDGNYRFVVMPDADRSDPDNDPYIIREVQQDGWVRTTANPGPITITATHEDQLHVDFGNQHMMPGFNLVKVATVEGDTADYAGEVIHYTLSLQNTGNQTLTGVNVSDPFISDLTRVADLLGDNDNLLEVNEVWSYTASHVVTQAEIDAGGNIINEATATSDQTGPAMAGASIPVEQRPGLSIVKEATVPGGTADYAGEVISYTISVHNEGNQTLTGVNVSDPFISDLTRVADAVGNDDDLLDVNETWSYTASHVVTQAEMDAGQDILNLSTASTDQLPPSSDDAWIPVEQRPQMTLDKAVTGVVGGNGNRVADFAGDILTYTVTVTNPGNVTLTDVSVWDPMTGLDANNLMLTPGQSLTFAVQYVLTQEDLNNNGGGNGYLENTATASSAQTGLITDMEQVQVLPRPSLEINKSLAGISGGNGNGVADFVGDDLNYTITVRNDGNVTLTGVVVDDAKTGFHIDGVILQPGDIRVYSTHYELTQADIDSNGDGDGYVDNLATADSDQTDAIADGESVALLRTIGLGVNKSAIGVTGGNGNDFADAAGDVLNYSVRVYNAGTVTLTGVSVADPLTGLNESITTLAPGAEQTFYTSYVLQQSDLNSNGNGLGYLENTATVYSDQTAPTFDNESVPLVAYTGLYLNKSYVGVTGGNGNNLVDAVGDVLHYSIAVFNAGNVTLTHVSVNEPMTGLNIQNMTLNPGQSQLYQVSYTLTQADIDNNGGGDGYIDNLAVADSDQTGPSADSESVPLIRSIGMSFDEHFVGVSGGNGNTLVDAAGDVLDFSFTVTNLGSVTLTGVTVVDPLTGFTGSLDSLAPGADHVFYSSYILTQADLDTNGGGDGRIENLSTAHSDQTSPVTDTESIGVVYQPTIDLTKYVSVDDGVTWEDANSPTGPILLAELLYGPQYKFAVTNTGNITLDGVSVTDSQYDLNGGDPGTAHDFGTLAPGASAEWIFTGATYQAGQNSDVATATVQGMPLTTDVDNAYYLGA